MHVPLRAVWPPISLAALDFVLIGLTLALGWWPLSLLLKIGLVILLFDIRSRRRDYRTACEYLKAGRNPTHIAKGSQYSWCGRAACLAAADTAGVGPSVRAYYRGNGYRWFHIFPDNTFTLRSPFLKARFWQVTLFGNSFSAAAEDQAVPKASRLVDELEKQAA